MIERASILERVASAMNGSDSSDYLAALAMAQAAPGHVSAGDAKILAGVAPRGIGLQAAIASVGAHITRLQTTASQLSYNQARDSIAGLVRRLNDVRRWKLDDKNVTRVAESTLLMHMHPTCPYCNGQQHELIEGTPHKDERKPCARCDGTGSRPMPRRNADQVAYVLNVLGLIQGLTERAVARRMG